MKTAPIPDLQQAKALLKYYRFVCQKTGNALLFGRRCGAFTIRVIFRLDTERAELLLSVQGEDESPRPWSAPVAPKPGPVALEAAWFVALAEDLTPPVVGGRLISEPREDRTKKARRP